jgi:nicotinamidase-related amidase
MTVTLLDPQTALVVIDLQKGLVAFPSAHPMAGVIANACRLAAAFRDRGLPVILVTVAGAPRVRTEQPRRAVTLDEGWTDLVPELEAAPGDLRVTKHTPGAFTGTGLEAHLRSLGVTQIVLAGISTSNGVEVTGRQAYELGFNTAFVLDAMTDANPEAHDYSVTRVFPRIGETGTTDDILARLKGEGQP